MNIFRILSIFLFLFTFWIAVPFSAAQNQSNDIELISAALLKNANLVGNLLSNGANPNAYYLDQKLVHYVIQTGDLRTALILIKAGANFSGIIKNGQDAFSYIAGNYDGPMVQGTPKQLVFDLLYELAQRGYNYTDNFNNNNLNNNAWYLVIKNNKVNHILLFLNILKTYYPWHASADINQVFVLLDGASLTPLILSIKLLDEHSQQPKVGGGTFTTLLRSDGLDPNKKVCAAGNKLQSALSYVFETNSQTYDLPIGYIIDCLIKKGANLAEAIQLFINNGGSPNHEICDKRWNQKWSLLGLAVFYNDIEAIKILLSHSANVNQSTDCSMYSQLNVRGNHTALYFALHNNNKDILQLLIEHGAKV